MYMWLNASYVQVTVRFYTFAHVTHTLVMVAPTHQKYIYKYYVMNYSINSFTGASKVPACSSCRCRCSAYTERATPHRDGQRGGEILTMKICFPSFWVSKWIFFKNWNINLILLLESFLILFTDFKNSNSIKSYE